ncbi:MAG: hypothetical protein JWQ95_158 [Sphaerisporangium sp.]|nr:hypothetical protein [Sphaerisporangium sp.]
MTGISPQTRQWRVRRGFTVLKGAGVLAFVVLGVVAADDLRGVFLCAGAAVLLAAFALRDVLAPVRLAADDQGLTVVTGLSRRERVLWPEVAHIRVGWNARYGLRWELLEIETSETLHLFSSHELGGSCTEAAEELFRIRPA